MDLPPQPTYQFSNLTENELREAFLAASNGPLENGNNFFNQFKYKFDVGVNPAASLIQGLDLLNRCQSIDQTAYARIHKGSAYYWLGMAAWFMKNHEMATFFFDAAVSEDIRAGHNLTDNLSPSFLFMLLDTTSDKQAALELVQVNRARIEELISNYNSRPGRLTQLTPMTISDLQERFLRKPFLPGGENLRSAVTTFISFSMEWELHNLLFDIQPVQGTTEPYFLHLFKGCVLFESLLKANPRKPPRITCNLNDVLQHLHIELGIPPNLNINSQGFQAIINNLASANDSIQTAIQYTGQIRNTLGHNLGWIVNLEKNHYHLLFRMVSSSCLHAISCLYPP
jgi:hypothetical protein